MTIQESVGLYTCGMPRWNDMFEMSSHTLLDMVRFIMNRSNLAQSFWEYAPQYMNSIIMYLCLEPEIYFFLINEVSLI